MVDPHLGLTVVFNGCIYNYKQLRAELQAAGLPVLLDLGHRGHAQGLHRVGHGLRRPLPRHVRVRGLEHGTGRLVLARDRLGIKPLYVDQRRDRLRFASTLPALLAGGGVDTSIDRTALHHYMTFHSVVPAPRTILHRRPQAAAGHGARRRAGRRHPRHRLLDAGVHPRPRPPRLDRPRLGGGAAGRRCASPSTGGWSPTCRSACCSPAASTPAWSWRCWPRPASPACRRSASASSRPAGSPATSSSTPTWSPSGSAPTTTSIPIDTDRLLPGHRRRGRAR